MNSVIIILCILTILSIIINIYIYFKNHSIEWYLEEDEYGVLLETAIIASDSFLKQKKYYADLLKVFKNNNMPYKYVWMPPPSKGQTKISNGYNPMEWFDFNNSFGSSDEQKALLDFLNSKNILPVADVVITHRFPSEGRTVYKNPAMGNPLQFIVRNDDLWNPNVKGKGPLSCQKLHQDNENTPINKNSFINFCNSAKKNDEKFIKAENECCKTITSLDPPHFWSDVPYTNRFGPKIAHANPEVQKITIEYLNKLKSIGYKGWRYDFAPGLNPLHVEQYNQGSNPDFSVVEYWSSSKDEIINYLNGTKNNEGIITTKAFDFPLAFILENISNTKSFINLQNPGLASWNPKYAVTFVNNHDLIKEKPNRNRMNFICYIYILTHPGTPCLYITEDKTFNNIVSNAGLLSVNNETSDKIQSLIKLRTDAGISNTKKNIVIYEASTKAYVAKIDGKYKKILVNFGVKSDPKKFDTGNWTQIEFLSSSLASIPYYVYTKNV